MRLPESAAGDVRGVMRRAAAHLIDQGGQRPNLLGCLLIGHDDRAGGYGYSYYDYRYYYGGRNSDGK